MGALRALRLPSSLLGVRALGIGEVVVGLAAIVTFARPLLVLVAAMYLGFAAFVVAALQADTSLQSCGCFGQTDTPPSFIHVWVNLLSAGTVLAAALTATSGLDVIAPAQPLRAVPFALLVVVCTYMTVIVLTVLPQR